MSDATRRYGDDDYRAAARRLRGEPEIDAPYHGTVQRCEGGAYVELLLWVPDSAADDIRQERAFNMQQRITIP